MEFKLNEGMIFEKEKVVKNTDSAKFYGSGSLDVFATPAMIALMEEVSKECVQNSLPEGYTTVGIEVNVKHIKATALNMKVKAITTLEKIENKKLIFKVEAFDEKGAIGIGTHTRYIVHSKTFMDKL